MSANRTAEIDRNTILADLSLDRETAVHLGVLAKQVETLAKELKLCRKELKEIQDYIRL